MPQPLPDDIRQAILDDIRDGQLGCRAIARKHDVSPSTVSSLAKAAKVPDAFERSNQQKGARARAFDAKAERARLIEELYGEARLIKSWVFSPYTQIVSTPFGPELVTTKLPPMRDRLAAMTAFGIALDKALKLEKVDDDAGAAAGKSMVNDLFGALKLAYHQIVEEEAAEAEVDLTAPMELVEDPGGVG